MNLGAYLANILLEQDQKTIAIFPGAFKPPHLGHFNVVKRLSTMADEVVVLISPKSRGGISADESFAVWQLYKTLLDSNVSFRIAAENPITETYDTIKNNPDVKFIVAFGKGEGDRFNQIKNTDKYYNVSIFDAGSGEYGISATNLRNTLINGDMNSLEKYLPKGIDVLDFKNAINYSNKEELHEAVPPEFEQDDYQDYILIQRDKIEKAAAYFNLPIPDMEYAFNVGNPVVLGDNVWSILQNTNSYNIETLEQAIRYAHGKGIKVKPYIEAIKMGKEMPLPLVLCYGQDKYWLISGEIILSLYRALKVIPTVLQGTLNLQESKSNTNKQHDKKSTINENIISDKNKYIHMLNKLTNECCGELKIEIPKITIINNPKYTETNKSYGGYFPKSNEIKLVIYGRLLKDSMVTLCHELYHAKQNSEERLTLNAGEDGDVFENESNSYAGKYMRMFGRNNPEIYFMKYK